MARYTRSHQQNKDVSADPEQSPIAFRNTVSNSAAGCPEQRHPFWLRTAAFVLILALVMIPAARVLQLKAVEQSYYSAISTYSGFYSMERDTVDVLFLGSSHAYCGFSPQEMYDHSGIRSYNLGSSQQSALMSYYWLREALRFQHPRAVVLETFYTKFALGNEGSIRKSFDYMHWSPVKWQAMQDLLACDPEEFSATELMLPLERYHSRWTELNEDDFSWHRLASHAELKGYSPVNYTYGKDNQAQIQENPAASDSGYPEIDPLALKYLEKITELCKEKNIRLILVKTPCNENNWNTACWQSLQSYASDHAIDYLDYNTASLVQRTGYDFPNDNADSMHCNLTGAVKVTDDLGDYLSTECGVPSVPDAQWEDTREYVANVEKDAALSAMDDTAFVTALQDPRYAVFFSAKSDDYSWGLALSGDDTPDSREWQALQEILQHPEELPDDLPGNPDDGSCGSSSAKDVVIDGRNAVTAASPAEVRGTFRDGKSRYYIESAPDESSIQIDGREYSPDEEGINVAVYSLDSRSVIDTRTFPNS